MQEYKNIPENKKNISVVKPGNKAQAQKGHVKKKKKISVVAVICILLILAICGAGAAIYFNIGGTKQMVVSFLQADASATASPESSGSVTQADLDAQAADLTQEKETLDAKDKTLKQKEDGLNTKEDGLNTKEQDIQKREDAVTAAENNMNAESQAQSALLASAKIFEQMDPAKAAVAISGMKTIKDMANVLLNMASDKAALILNQMKPALATKILAAMIK